EVKAVLTAHAKPDVYRRISYRAALVPKDSCPATQKYRPMSRRAEEVRLAAKGLQPGEWRLLVQTQGAPGYEEMTVPLRVLPPGNPHEVIIDEYNRLLVDGKPMFPCGFYGAPDNDELTKPIADAGYNTVLTYAQDPEVCRRWLDMCQRLGLWGIVHVPRPFVPNFDEDKLRAAVRKVKDHPALLAYYLFDEPSPSRPGERPEDLKRVYDVLVDEDPYHPVTICINVPANERVYLESYDVLMIDVYPVRHVRGRLTEIAERMDHAWSSTEGRKPVWFIPQTFGWDVVVGLEGPPTWLTPTPEEERAMQYLALTHGARGSVAYCYHVYTGYDAEAKKKGQWPWKLGGYLPTQQKALWSALAQLGAEYKALQAALTQPAVAQAQFGTIHVAWFTDGGPDAWLLAVNGERDHKDEQAVPALPPEISRTPARAEDAFTGRPVELKAGKLNLRLNPMETVAIRTRLR
ncbi:MAG: hypothetical protein H5T86_12580, partial [Armatimonadetes bacterium]|nr:hypothetical protein [Armatimonadota bacterium]